MKLKFKVRDCTKLCADFRVAIEEALKTANPGGTRHDIRRVGIVKKAFNELKHPVEYLQLLLV
jgi:hypothetical protein